MFRLAAAVLLAGCAASLPRRLADAEPAAEKEWAALSPARRFEVMREGLRGGDGGTRRIAALSLDPKCLTLEEIRVAERDSLTTVFTTDRDDFESYRIGRRGRFRIVPAPS